MKRMTVEELYNYLCSPQFLDEKSGNIFYNYYIYQYPASNEYEMRRQIQEFREKLERPTNFVNALELDLFKVFCEYLSNEKFGDTSLLEDTFEGDKTHPEMVTTELTSEANSDNFIRFVRDKIESTHGYNDGYNKPYVFIHGNRQDVPIYQNECVLTRYEKYNDTSRYKIILFYPGHQEGNSFSLFDTLEDAHTYRAILLVNK
jgi:hypothetical protein